MMNYGSIFFRSINRTAIQWCSTKGHSENKDIKTLSSSMCGIAGIILASENKHLKSVEEKFLAEFSSCLKYRGPDEEGSAIKNHNGKQIAFAHKRLSIIDLSETGRQPMWSGSGNSLIIFNGEIYNYAEIKNALMKEGCSFKGSSDTEVILEAYERWGIERMLDSI